MHVEKYHAIQNIVRHLIENDAQPKVTDFEWLFEQMQQWNALESSSEISTELAQNCLLPQIYKTAAVN